jgi:energy-converting hydrogenase Eha subunit G
MTLAEAIGSVGVALLLLAFVLNLRSVVGRQSRLYQGMNAIGAGLAAYASWLIGFVPFVVLETVWCLAALSALAGRRNG